MSSRAQDLVYLAMVYQSIQKYCIALNCLQEAFEIDRGLIREKSSLIGCILKTAIDPIRDSIKTIQNYLDNSGSSEMAGFNDALNTSIMKSRAEIDNLCENGFSLIKKCLETDMGSETTAFFNKLQGDLFRYRCEQGIQLEESLKNAQSFYLKAIEMAQRDLSLAHPVRLGTVLNYAVFLYEHLDKYEEAILNLTSSAEDATHLINELSENSQNESQTIIEVMRSNLQNWSVDSSDEEDI